MRKILEKKGLLYLILDKGLYEEKQVNIFKLAEKSAKAGVDFFQFRFGRQENDSQIIEIAKKLRLIIKKYRRIFIINNRIDIALAVKADGVHIGENDMPETTVRKIAGRSLIIGKTIHNTNEIKKAKQKIIDYISIGPVFPTETKPKLKPLGIEKAKDILRLAKKPAFVIGGINLNNINILKKQGVCNIALNRGISLEKDIVKTVKQFKKILN